MLIITILGRQDYIKWSGGSSSPPFIIFEHRNNTSEKCFNLILYSLLFTSNFKHIFY